jgi:putative ABC transport system permease protein
MITIRPRWKKVWADLWGNKSRTVLVVLSIAIGVFAVGMVANSYLILDEASTVGYEAVNPTSAFIVASLFDDDLVDTVRKMPEVAEAEGKRIRSVRLFLNGRWYSSDLAALDYENSRVNLLQSTGGQAIPDDNQLLIDQTAVALTDYELGQTVIVEMSDGRRYEMPIVGQVRDQNSNPSINSGGVNIYTTLDTFEWLGEPPGYNFLLYVAAENQKDRPHILALTGEIKDKIEKNGYPVYFTLVFSEPGVSPTKFLIESIRSVLGILAVVSLALSAFLVFNTTSALILRQVQYIGIMKAFGGLTRQLVVMYLVMVIMFGLMAFVVAAPLAALAAQKFSEFIAGPALVDLPLTPYEIRPGILLLELIISLMVPILAALPAIWSGSRVTVLDALNSTGLSQENLSNSLLERFIERLRFMTGPWLLSLGNILRNRGRTALTLGTLVLGGAVFIGVLSVGASSDKTVEELGEAFRFDVQVEFERPYRLAQIEAAALQVPGVEQVEGWTAVSGAIVNENGEEGNSMTILAPPGGSDLTQPKIVDGRWLRPDDENALVIDTSLLREDPSLRVGDEITLKINGRETPWTIVGVYQTIGLTVWYEAYANYPYVARLAREVEQTRRVQLVTSKHDPASQAEAAALVDAYFQQLGIRVSSIETSAALRGIQEQQFDIIVAVLMIMALLITLVGGLGLAGTMSMNVLERTREIGVMRAVGASDGAVLRVVLVEGILMALMSWFLAIFLAVPAGKLLGGVVGQHIVNGELSYVYSVRGALIWLLLVLVVALLASYLPARNASKLTVRDVLAYE